MEYRRRCNVCGKIYCYSDKDLSENTSNSAMAAISAIGGLASIFGGTRLDTYALNNKSDRYSSKVVDYNKCPSCNSTNTSLITDTEWMEMQQKETASIQTQVIQTKKIDINSNATSDSLLKRTKMFLEEEDWDSASAYCEQILDIDPECAMAYVYKLMIELKVTEQDKLALLSETFSEEKLYQKAIRFADDSLKSILEGYNYTIIERNNERAYSSALNAFNTSKTEQDCKALIPRFKALGNYKNSAQMVRECEEKAVLCKYNHAVQLQQRAKTEKEFLEAKSEFDSISSYSDAGILASVCRDKAEEARKNAIYDEAISSASSFTIMTVENAVKEFEKIPGWRDADQKKIEALNRVDQLKQAEKKAANKKKTIYILSVSAVVVCIAIVLIAIQVIKNNKYNSANEKYASGDYIAAIQIWAELEDYKDSTDRIQDSAKPVYNEAMNLLEQKEYDAAIAKLDSLASYLPISQDKAYCYYMIAFAYAQSGDYSNALSKLESASDYPETEKLKLFCESAQELNLLNDGEEHNLREMYDNIKALALEFNQTSLLNSDCFNMMLSLNGNWYGYSDYKTTFSDGRINIYDEGYLKYEWDVVYRSGKYYMGYAGERGKASYQCINGYSGAGDNSFTYEDYFYYDDDQLHDFESKDTYDMKRR